MGIGSSILLIIIIAIIVVIFFITPFYLKFCRKTHEDRNETREIKIIKIYRRGFETYNILYRGENEQVLEHCASPHNEGTRLFTDVRDNMQPYALVTKNGNHTVKTEIHINSLDDIINQA